MKVIKYLENGEYHYATVKDVGDISQLKTTAKTDLVSAINDLYSNGVASNGISDADMDKIEQKISDANNSQTADFNGTVQQIEKAMQDQVDAANKNINAAQKELDDTQKDIDSMNAKFDSADDTLNQALADLKKSNQTDIDTLKSEISQHNDDIKTINDKADALSGDLSKTQDTLTQVKADLDKSVIGQSDLSTSIDQVKKQVTLKADQTSLDDAQEQIQKNTENITINAKGLVNKVDQEDLDLANQNITKIQSKLTQYDDEISGMVSKDTLNNKIQDFEFKKLNLLLGTRDWYQWNISNPAYIRVTNEMYNHCYWTSVTKVGETINEVVSGLVSGNTYTLSVVAKTLKDGDTINVTAGTKIGTLSTSDNNQKVTSDPQTFSISFTATSETMTIGFGMIGSLSSGNALYINEAKLETGTVVTYWEMNPADNYDRIQHSEAQLKVYDNQISTLTDTQTKIGDKQTELSSSLSQLDDKITLTQENLTKTNNSVTDVSTKVDSKAGELTATFNNELNQAINNISDSSSNQIFNSAFTSKTDHWQAVSAKATLSQDNNNKEWIDFKQDGLNSDSPIAMESNYFAVKNQDSVVIAFDLIRKSDVGLSNPQILVVEVFDKNNTRVDFKNLNITDFDNGSGVANDTAIRLKYKYVVNHSDATKVAIKPILVRNGHLQFTDFFATVSTISDGSYVANANDNNEIVYKQQLQIQANTNSISLKASQSSVDTLSQSVSNQSSQLSVLSDQVSQKTSKTDFDTLTGRVSNAEQKIQANANSVTSTLSKVSGLQTQVDNSAVGTNLLLNSGNGWLGNAFQAPKLPDSDITVDGVFVANSDGIMKLTAPDSGEFFYRFSNPSKSNTLYGLTAGQTYTISGLANLTDGQLNFRAQTVNGSGGWNNFTGSQSGDLGVTNSDSTTFTKFSYTFTIPSVATGIYISFQAYNTTPNTSVLSFKQLKLELGSHATDYSANPADNATVTSLNVVKQTADETYQGLFNSDGSNKIDITAQGLQGQIKDNKNNLANVKVTADKAYQGLFNSDGSNRIDSTAAGTIQEINSTKTELQGYADNSATNKANDALNNAKSYANTQVSNIKIGGTNLVPLSNIVTATSTQTAYDASNDIRTLTVVNGAGGTWGGGIQNNGAIKHEIPWNSYYTYSVEIMPLDSGLHWNSDANSFPMSGNSWSGNDNDDVGHRVIGDSTGTSDRTLIPNVWNKVWVTYQNTSSNNTSKVSLYDNSTVCVVNNSGKTVTVKFRHFQGEIGNKPTDWSLANEDIQLDAQSRADSALNNAKSYTNSKATVLQTDYDNKISNTSKEFTEKWTAVTKQVQDSAVGTNLLKGTQNLDSTYWYLSDSSKVNAEKGQKTDTHLTNSWITNSKVIHSYGDWGSFRYSNPDGLSLEKGKIYTISIYARTYDNSESGKMYITAYEEGGIGVSGHDLTSSLDTTFRQYSTTFTATGNTIKTLRIEPHGDWNSVGGSIYMFGYKLEKGDHATDWCPAPEDSQTYAETLIDATAGELQAKVNGADYHNLISMNSNGILLDAHGVNNSNKSIILSGDHVKIDSSNPVQIPNAAIPNLSGKTIQVSNYGINIQLDGSGIHVDDNDNQTWINKDGIFNGNNTYTRIKNGIIYTNVINANNKLHIGNLDESDSRKIWGTDIDVNGLSFSVPVKKSGATNNNASSYQTEIQGYINAQGWNYKTTDTNGTGYSGIVIGLATQQEWGTPYGGDFVGIGKFNPTGNIPNASSGNIGSSDFEPAIAYWATGAGTAYPANSVSIAPPLYLGDGHIRTLSGDIDLSPAGSLGLFGNFISMESTGTIHIKANGGNYIRLYSNNQMDIDGGSFWTSNGSGFWFWQGINGTGGAVVHGKSFANVSLLSAKTNISKINSATALDKINQTNIYDYQYKNDVENGSTKHYASFIIDDINDVSQYTEPDEFLSEDKKGRDDGTQLAYATLAIQELSKQIEELKQEINKLKQN